MQTISNRTQQLSWVLSQLEFKTKTISELAPLHRDMSDTVIRLRAYSVPFSLQHRWFKVTKKHYNPCGYVWCIICLIYSSSTFLITRFNLSWSVLQETCGQSNRKPWQLSHCVCLCLNEANWAPLLSHWFRYWLHIKDLFFYEALFLLPVLK